MTAEQFANSASSTLNGAINASVTSLIVTSATPFPSVPQFRLLLGNDSTTGEIVLVTAVAGTTFTVLRGQESTTAQSWISGSTITHILTAGAVSNIRTTGGDVSGTTDNLTVIKINGTTVPATPSANQVLIASSGTAAIWNTIANVNVSAGAAIAGTKISPDFGSQVLQTTGLARFGPSAGSSASGFGISWPVAGIDTVFVYNASGDSYYTNWSGSSTNVGGFLAYNTSAGASATIGVAVGGAGLSHATTAIAGNGFLEQAGSATSCFIFRKILGNATSPGTSGRIYQSGAWSIGDATQNDTSSEAQAGLTGTLINISQITGGTLTSTSNQALLYNSTGMVILQGDTGHSLIAGTTTVASTSTSKFITNVGKRIKTNVKTTNYTVLVSDEVIIIGALSGSITITLPASPTAGDIYTIKDQGGSAATFNIIISGNGNNIDGVSSYTMNANYESVTVVFANGSWSIV